MSLADDVVGSEPLLAPILDLQRFSKPTTAEVLQRDQRGCFRIRSLFARTRNTANLAWYVVSERAKPTA